MAVERPGPCALQMMTYVQLSIREFSLPNRNIYCLSSHWSAGARRSASYGLAACLDRRCLSCGPVEETIGSAPSRGPIRAATGLATPGFCDVRDLGRWSCRHLPVPFRSGQGVACEIDGTASRARCTGCWPGRIRDPDGEGTALREQEPQAR